MIIYHNIPASFASRQLYNTNLELSKSIEKLSSGDRINRAGNDPAGLAISEKMRSQVRGLYQAARNAQDAISFVQTTEGALQEAHSILHRVRELAIQSANGIYTTEDRAQVQVEVSQLLKEIDRVATATEFNKFKMLNGTQLSMQFHIGANADQVMKVSIGTMTTQALGLANLSISSPEQANTSLASVDQAVNRISKQRADLGAYQARLEHAVKSLSVASENMMAAESRIRDTDFASEIIQFTKSKLLLQTGVVMLAQANINPQAVLKLIE
ncbi:MAG: flagellin [Spirochaetes bacterium]|nr:flagellin [Spirochaetota bacterium]